MCSTPLTDEHRHTRCDDCHAQRAAADYTYRKQTATARFPEVVRRMLTARLAAGEHLTDVCRSLETTTQQAHGFKVFDRTWAEELDGALLAGRDPDLNHGTITAYRKSNCRCPECREYKLNHDSWKWRRLPVTRP
jgi:hypothetical protein